MGHLPLPWLISRGYLKSDNCFIHHRILQDIWDAKQHTTRSHPIAYHYPTWSSSSTFPGLFPIGKVNMVSQGDPQSGIRRFLLPKTVRLLSDVAEVVHEGLRQDQMRNLSCMVYLPKLTLRPEFFCDSLVENHLPTPNSWQGLWRSLGVWQINTISGWYRKNPGNSRLAHGISARDGTNIRASAVNVFSHEAIQTTCRYLSLPLVCS